jgi:hypothetical protein
MRSSQLGGLVVARTHTARFVVGLDADIRNGALSPVTRDLSRLAGRLNTPLIDTLRSLS